MAKPATNRANLKYAVWLKKNGYKTAVHALPQEALIMLHQMLEKGATLKQTANAINSKFSKEMSDKGMKPLTFQSVHTYKTNYWKDTSSGRRAELEKDPEMKQQIDDLFEKFNALFELTKITKHQVEIAEMVTLEKDKKVRMATEMGNDTRQEAFRMLKELINLQFELGVIQRTPMEMDVNITDNSPNKEMDENQKKLLAMEMIDMAETLQNKGRYGKREPKLNANQSNQNQSS